MQYFYRRHGSLHETRTWSGNSIEQKNNNKETKGAQEREEEIQMVKIDNEVFE